MKPAPAPAPFTGISFIICHRQGEDISTTVTSIKNSVNGVNTETTGGVSYEVITVQGNHPTLQRNVAVSYARYSHIYFLDNDSEVDKNTMKHLIDVLSSPAEPTGYPHALADIIGGPSLLHVSANYFEHCADGLLSCRWVVGMRAARYSQNGNVHRTDSRELILCNMVVRKDFFIRAEGFNSRLYPNEENEIIVRALEEGAEVYYDPKLVIRRGQRKDLSAFIKQMLDYGRGRGEELRIWLSRKCYPSHKGLSGQKGLVGYTSVVTLALVSFGLSFCILGFTLSLLLTSGILPVAYINENATILKTAEVISAIGKDLVFWYLVYLALVWVKVTVNKKRFLRHLPLLVVSCHVFYIWGFLKAGWTKGFASETKRFWFWFSSPVNKG